MVFLFDAEGMSVGSRPKAVIFFCVCVNWEGERCWWLSSGVLFLFIFVNWEGGRVVGNHLGAVWPC